MFEIQTFALTLLPLLLASLTVLLVNWRIHARMRGPGYWAAGAAGRLAGAALIAVGSPLPEFLTSVAGYWLILAGDFLALKGLCLFAARPFYKRTTAIVLAGVFLGISYFTYVRPEPYGPIILLVAGHAVSIFLLVFLQWRLRHEGFGGILILALSSFWEIFLSPMLLWVMHQATNDVDFEVMLSNMGWGWVQPMSAMAMIGILQTFGFMLLAANRTQRELRDMALLDTLTGMPNRRSFDSTVKRAVEATKRNGSRLGLAVIDIDFFKKVNDTYGHGVGDELLRHVARTISGTLRDSDFFARIGGEEFALLVQDTTPGSLTEIVERFRQAVESMPLTRSGEPPLGCTISAGLALSRPGCDPDCINATQLYAQADAALYRAKGNGRNRVEMG